MALAAIRHIIQRSEHGGRVGQYGVLFGGGTFSDFSRHPNKLVKIGRYRSTAAGAYQINYPTWQEICAHVKLADFSPASQDAACDWLILRCGPVVDVISEDFERGCKMLSGRWASIPGNAYGQPLTPLATLRRWYDDFLAGQK
jgi:muramidase (phage lysozyme)